MLKPLELPGKKLHKTSEELAYLLRVLTSDNNHKQLEQFGSLISF